MAELNRDGPLMEYGRRIANGELLDGDSSQVCSSSLEECVCVCVCDFQDFFIVFGAR